MVGECVKTCSRFSIFLLHVPEFESSVMDVGSGIFLLLFGSLLVRQMFGPVFFQPLLSRSHFVVRDLLAFD